MGGVTKRQLGPLIEDRISSAVQHFAHSITMFNCLAETMVNYHIHILIIILKGCLIAPVGLPAGSEALPASSEAHQLALRPTPLYLRIFQLALRPTQLFSRPF